MLEFLLLFVFFYWVFSRFDKKRKKRKLFKPSLDQELAELIQAEDNSTGIALSVKQYLLDVLDDDKNDREKYSQSRLDQGQEILDKAGASALYFMADIATQLSIVASAQINGIPNNVEAELRGAATPENIINKVIKIWALFNYSSSSIEIIFSVNSISCSTPSAAKVNLIASKAFPRTTLISGSAYPTKPASSQSTSQSLPSL